MTNETLAELIQQGDNDELIPILWEKVKGALIVLCRRYYGAHSALLQRYGYSESDLYQESYSAMLAAVKAYKAEKGYKFTTYLTYSLQHIIRNTLYSGKYDALNQANTTSFEQPIGENKEGDKLILADIVEDETAAASMEQVERSDYFNVLYEALETLTDKQQEVINIVYFKGLSVPQAAIELDMTHQGVRNSLNNALTKLRSGEVVAQLRRIYGEEYGYYDGLRRKEAHHKSYMAFLSSRSSEVEDAAFANIMREQRNSVAAANE